MTDNPYEPPLESSDPPPEEQASHASQPVHYVGGWPMVAGVGVLGGGLFGGLFVMGSEIFDIVNPYLLIGVIWVSALGVITMSLRGTLMSTSARLITAVFMAPVGLVLFVPVCSFGAMFANGGNYNVGEPLAAASSVVSFTFVLLLLASIIRSFVAKKQRRSFARQAGNDPS